MSPTLDTLQRIKELAVRMLENMALPPDMLTYALEHCYYSGDYKEQTADSDGALMCIIADELPLLASTLLVRDTLNRTLREFAGPQGSNMANTRAYHLLRLNEALKDMCWGLAHICIFQHPTIYPESFRTHRGHLVLVGSPDGVDAIEGRAKGYISMHALAMMLGEKMSELPKGALDKMLQGLGSSSGSSGHTVGDKLDEDDMMRLMPTSGRKKA